MNERILCLDIGDVRIGVAVSDPLRMIASPVEVITRVGWGPDVQRIKDLCAQYETTVVLSGLPLNMNGSAGFQSEKVKQFCAQLEKAGLTVYYQDERLTTVTAEHALLEDNISRRERKTKVDKVAAAVILQQWLDTQQHQKEANTMSENNNPNNNEETFQDNEGENLIELIDEEGNTVPFIHLDTIEYEGNYYIALMPADEDEEDAGVLIMQITKDEKGEDCYVTLEDEKTEEAVFNLFLERIEDEEDYEVGEAPEDDQAEGDKPEQK